MAIFAKLRNRKFFGGMDEAAKRANTLYNKKGGTVVCIYCGQLLLKKEAAVVYDLEKNENEYSHEKCWQKNNRVSDGPPIMKGETE